MITLSPAAADQIRAAAAQGGIDQPMLRVAAKADGRGAIDYAMGFDEPKPGDQEIVSHGITLLVAPVSEDLLDGLRIDYVEIEPGELRFIFINPNDPNQTPPQEDGSA